MKGFFIRFFVIIALVIIAACAPTTLKSVWRDDAYHGGHLKKVLIIGVDRNVTVKALLEDEFVETA